MKTLEAVLEEIAPQPDPDFASDMEWRMQHGFPASRTAQVRSRPRFALPNLRPRAWAAAAASFVLALAVTASLLGGGSANENTSSQVKALPVPSDAGAGAGTSAPDAAAPPVTERALTAEIPPPTGDGVAPQARVRRVERSAQLTLAADPTDFDGLADSIFRTADRHQGFVLRSSFSQTDGPASNGFFELRVPPAELEPALNELSRLATVRARSESGTDVTSAFLSVRHRLRTAQAERKSLLRRLELAVTDTAANTIRRRLAIVGRKIGGLSAQLRAARERTDYATVLVDLVDEDAAATTGDTDQAVDDAVGSFEDILNFLIRAMGVLVPLAAVALVVWLVAAFARRRARERALA